VATQSSMLAGAVAGSPKLKEIKQRALFLFLAVVVFRFGSHITIPGLDPIELARIFDANQGTIIDMFDMFGGGALKRLSIFALGIMPYISSSIIVQLMAVVIPALEKIKKEGEAGRRKITQYTRYLTVILATFQSVGICYAFYNQGAVMSGLSLFAFVVPGALTLVTGTLFLMWLGEQVTERGIGNGISMIIFAGIVSGLPRAIGGTLELARTGEMGGGTVLGVIALAALVTGFVVFVERGQRRITVNYAKRQQGGRIYQAQSTHLPLKLNMAGVIPPIFASSIVLFPATLGSWLGGADGMSWLRDITTKLQPGQPIYTTCYAIGIIFFCFFYTALVFNSRETADNLKKSGAFIPGIRPGESTARYIDGVLSRLTMVGAIYITLVCLIPEFLIIYWNVPFYFGGTSLLIIVVVVMDFMAQLQAHLMSQQYDNLMKKANLKSHSRSGRVRGKR
jgi:preprotein translocase subunit SecY